MLSKLFQEKSALNVLSAPSALCAATTCRSTSRHTRTKKGEQRWQSSPLTSWRRTLPEAWEPHRILSLWRRCHATLTPQRLPPPVTWRRTTMRTRSLSRPLILSLYKWLTSCYYYFFVFVLSGAWLNVSFAFCLTFDICSNSLQ